jgi:hypothetical protein
MVKDHVIFIPKFIKYQYPDFPKSKVRQQGSAIKILIEYNLFDIKNSTLREDLFNSCLTVSKDLVNSCLTVSKDLSKSYDNDNENEYVYGNENEPATEPEPGNDSDQGKDIVIPAYKTYPERDSKKEAMDEITKTIQKAKKGNS